MSNGTMKKLLLMACLFGLIACSNPQERACRQLSEKYIQNQGKDSYKKYDLLEWNSFYSNKYDACIHTEKKIVGFDYFIGDLSRTIRKGHYWFLLNCDASGADRVIIESLPRLHGREDEVSSTEYTDDGEGGPARSDKSSPPWTKERCERVFNKVIADLKG